MGRNREAQPRKMVAGLGDIAADGGADLDLAAQIFRADLIAKIGKRAGHEELSHVLANGDKEALDAFLWGRDTLDLLNLAPGLKLDPAEFLGWLKPLQHRAYSISSSPKAHPGEVHLTVAAVRWMAGDRAHGGVCSTFLADQQDGSSARI